MLIYHLCLILHLLNHLRTHHSQNRHLLHHLLLLCFLLRHIRLILVILSGFCLCLSHFYLSFSIKFYLHLYLISLYCLNHPLYHQDPKNHSLMHRKTLLSIFLLLMVINYTIIISIKVLHINIQINNRIRWFRQRSRFKSKLIIYINIYYNLWFPFKTISLKYKGN
jgi:hypothetical protein